MEHRLTGRHLTLLIGGLGISLLFILLLIFSSQLAATAPLQQSGDTGIPPDPNCQDGLCVFYISDPLDDAGYEPWGCTFQTANSLYFGTCDRENYGKPITTSMIFRNITLPPNTKIARAYLEFTTDSYVGTGIQTAFYGEASSNPRNYAAGNPLPEKRPWINPTAPIFWRIKTTTPWENGRIRISPDLTPIVQAIVNRTDWNKGGGINIIAATAGPSPNTPPYRRIHSYDNNQTSPPRLVIQLAPETVIPAFSSENRALWQLINNAAVNPDTLAVSLTNQLSAHQRGQIWYRIPQNALDRFETVFDFRMKKAPGQNNTGNGLAFVLHYGPQGPYAIGGSDCTQGYGNMKNSLAIEFDTPSTECSSVNDPNAHHVAVQILGDPTHNVTNTPGIVSLPNVNLTDGNIHTARITYQYDPQTAAGMLKIYLDQIDPDATPILSVPLILSDTLSTDAGALWVGFTAASDNVKVDQSLFNTYFAPDWDMTCLSYDFATENLTHNFVLDNKLGNDPVLKHGWRTSNGRLSLNRGMDGNTPPLLINDDFDFDLIEKLLNSTLPLQSIRLEYTWANDYMNPDGLEPPMTSTAAAHIELKSAGGASRLIERILTPAEPQSSAHVLISDFNMENLYHPTGLRVRLEMENPKQAIYIRRIGLCFNNGAPPRPPLPTEEEITACHDLQQLLESRYQPFGPSTGQGKQAEIHATGTITLEPYLNYKLDASGYPDSLTYTDTPTGVKLVPCAYKDAQGDFYDPNPSSGVPASPIVRFAALGDPEWQERMVLLNYAAYFSVGGESWCHARDNVFNSIQNRYTPIDYTLGYNVPPPGYFCEIQDEDAGHPQYIETSSGPCGSFVGSLYRAMGYFDVDAIDQHYSIPSHVDMVTAAVGGLYYAVDTYEGSLAQNAYMEFSPLFVRRDLGSATTYVPRPVQFTALRVYPVHDCAQNVNGVCQGTHTHVFGMSGINPVKCKPEVDADCEKSRTYVGGHWLDPIVKEISPANQGTPSYDPESLWQAIKPGDIAISIINRNSPTPLPDPIHGNALIQTKEEDPNPTAQLNIHIQVVVGWGPSVLSKDYLPNSLRYGRNFYSTYTAVPENKRPEYVPYIMERSSLPGTSEGVKGPRPFNYRIWHTSTDFWVADYNPTALKQTLEGTAPTDLKAPIPEPMGSPLPPQLSGKVAWSPDGNWLAAGNQFGTTLYSADLETVVVLNSTFIATDLAWSPNNIQLAVAEADQTIHIWDINVLKPIATLHGHLAGLTGVSWNPQLSLLASSSQDGTVILWDTTSYKAIKTFSTHNSGAMGALTWSPNGKFLAASSADAIYLWDIEGNLINTFPIATFASESLQWTPDGTALLTSGPQLWDPFSGTLLRTYSACGNNNTRAALSPNGQALAAAGISSLKNVACRTLLNQAGEELNQAPLPTPPGILAIDSLDWHPNGTQIAMLTQAGWLYLWDPTYRELLAVAPRPSITLPELQTSLAQSVTDDRLYDQLATLLSTGNYSRFATTVESYTLQVPPPALPYLTKLAAYLDLQQWSLPAEQETLEAQPLSLIYIGKPWETANQSDWRVINPNPYAVEVYWGWAASWPQTEAAPFVVPAATREGPGIWDFDTPTNTRTTEIAIRIRSGSFSIGASNDPGPQPMLTSREE